MRPRLQLLLPALVGSIAAAGFLLVASSVGDAVRQTLLTVPGITRDRAVEEAVATVVVVGALFTVLAVVATALLARAITRSIQRLERTIAGSAGADDSPGFRTSIREIQDLGDSIDRTARERRDRHERENRERSELRALVDAVSEGIVQVDAEGRVVRANPAGRALLGLPADAVGQPINTLLRDATLRAAVSRAADGEATGAAEVVLEGRRVLASVAPQEGGGVVATLVDLTDLRRLEEVRRDFVANASHELKTPLTSIRGYTDTLLTGDLPEADRQHFLAVVSRNAERLQRIVDDLLDLSRLESGRWRPELEPVDVHQLAGSAWSPFADRARDAGVAFAIRPGPEHRALADRRALEQIFTNLYDNALRYTPAGGRIDVSTRSRREGPEPAEEHRAPASPAGRAGDRTAGETDGWLVIEVADTGAGIPRDAVPRIFERFYRVDPARSRAEGGTGLGLSIVRHLAESMGGAVRAESVLGKGTRLAVWLPAADS